MSSESSEATLLPSEPPPANDPGPRQSHVSHVSHVSRVAAFARLGAKRGRVPLINQVSASDCGPACVAMVLGYFGKPVPLASVRAAVGGAAQGVSARQLVDAARRFGLRARGVKLELEQLRYLPPGSILHWEMNHFVVLEAVDRRGARIVDPASGPRRIAWQDLAERCTGVALVCEPTPELLASAASQRPARSANRARYLRWLRAAPGYWPRVLVLSAILQLVALCAPLAVGLTIDKIVPR